LRNEAGEIGRAAAAVFTVYPALLVADDLQPREKFPQF